MKQKILCILLFLFTFNMYISGQTGYIYVHSKTLNEAGSPNVTYTVSGGPTVVPDFTLNDDPSQTPVLDIGSAENGRLWATSSTNMLYYRDANSTVWIQTPVTNAVKVDGGPFGTCFYISTAGTVFAYSGAGAPTQISAAGQFNNAPWTDIGSGWTGTPTGAGVPGPAVYAVKDDGNVYKWSGTGTTWNIYATVPTFAGYRVDVNPTNGNVYFAGNTTGAGTVRTVREITPAGAPAAPSIGSGIVGANAYAYKDIAVNQNGEVYVVANDQVNQPTGAYVHKYAGGTSWVKETGSFDAYRITGGIAGSLWNSMASGGWGFGTYPFYNIFSRAYDGTNVTYIDDERVRTTAGNSQLIPVLPGTYTITETIPGGWDLQKILLYDPTANSTANQVAGTATITVTANEVVNVVFQTGQLNPIAMTNSCSTAYLETFGTGLAGTYGTPVAGQTSYHFLSGNAPGEDGYYKIVNRANPDFNLWGGAAGIVDHTPGDADQGYMYAVNAGYDKGEFFRRRFTGVIPGATYNFSAWIVDLTASAQVNPNVSFLVLDHTTQVVLGSYTTGDLTSIVEPDTWQNYGFSFTATAADIDLVISNNGFGGNGNDLAIDDISFALIPSGTPVTAVTHVSCAALGSIEVTFPLGASYEYSIDTALGWQPSVLFQNLSSGVYTVYARFAGTDGCVVTKTDTIKSAICGNVFNDGNGLTDSMVNGNGTNEGGLNAILIDPASGNVIAIVPVNGNGTYEFLNLPAGSYNVLITTETAVVGNAAPNVVLPLNWVNTGEDCCDNTGSDGSIDGILTGIVVGSTAVTNINFGIEQLPGSNNVTQTIPSPAINTIPAGVITNPVSGSDPEDGLLGNPNQLVITNLPVNATMFYNGIAVTPGQVINGFDPALISYTNITNRSTSIVFEYAFIDSAGQQDPTPATYIVNWAVPLPVSVEKFVVTQDKCRAHVLWTVSNEINFSHYEVERKAQHIQFAKIASVSSKYVNEMVTYTYDDEGLPEGQFEYRLKMIDKDGQYLYSNTQAIKTTCADEGIAVYPNPVQNNLYIAIKSAITQGYTVRIYNVMGKVIYEATMEVRENEKKVIPVSLEAYSGGIYHIIVSDEYLQKTFSILKD